MAKKPSKRHKKKVPFERFLERKEKVRELKLKFQQKFKPRLKQLQLNSGEKRFMTLIEARRGARRRKRLSLFERLKLQELKMRLHLLGLPEALWAQAVKKPAVEAVLPQASKKMEEAVKAFEQVQANSQKMLSTNEMVRERKRWKTQVERGIKKLRERKERVEWAEWKRLEKSLEAVKSRIDVIKCKRPENLQATRKTLKTLRGELKAEREKLATLKETRVKWNKELQEQKRDLGKVMKAPRTSPNIRKALELQELMQGSREMLERMDTAIEKVSKGNAQLERQVEAVEKTYKPLLAEVKGLGKEKQELLLALRQLPKLDIKSKYLSSEEREARQRFLKHHDSITTEIRHQAEALNKLLEEAKEPAWAKLQADRKKLIQDFYRASR